MKHQTIVEILFLLIGSCTAISILWSGQLLHNFIVSAGGIYEGADLVFYGKAVMLFLSAGLGIWLYMQVDKFKKFIPEQQD